MRRLIALQLIVMLLVACTASPPTHHYVLTANSPAAGEGDGSGSHVGVGPVSIPEYLQRLSMAYFQGDNTLQVAGEHRWSERLDDAIPRVVATNLARLDPDRIVTPYPWRQDEAPDLAIRIDVTHLNLGPDNRAVLEATWRIADPREREVRSRGRFRREQQLDEFSHGALAATYSDLLAELSQAIHEALSGQGQGARQ